MELSNRTCYVSQIRVTGHFLHYGVLQLLFNGTIGSPTVHTSRQRAGWGAEEKPRAHATLHNFGSDHCRDTTPSPSKPLSPTPEDDDEEASDDQE